MKKFLELLMSFLSKKPKTPNKNINNSDKPAVSNIHPNTIDDKSVGKIVTSIEIKEKPIKREIEPMYNFGKRSRERLDTCHKDIVEILEETIKIYDFSVLEGLRTAEKQMEYFETGRSKLDGVHKKSKHQDDGSGKSRAIDIMPYAKGSNAFSGKQKDLRRFYFLMGIVRAVSERLLAEGKISHSVRFGLDWNGNDLFDDQSFDDLPHLELITPKK